MAYHQLRIAKIVQETPDARSFVLEVPEELADRFRYRAGQFPHAERAAAEVLSLPMFPELTADQCEAVARAVIGLSAGRERVADVASAS